MVNLERLRDSIEVELSDQLAPELESIGAEKVYLILPSLAGIATSGTFYGIYNPTWSGMPGPVLVVDDRKLADHFGAGLLEQRIWEVAVHEASHAAIDLPVINREPDEVDLVCLEICRRAMIRSIEKTTPERESQITSEHAKHHGENFKRVAFHLARRVELRKNIRIELDGVFKGLSNDSVGWDRDVVPLLGMSLSEIGRSGVLPG